MDRKKAQSACSTGLRFFGALFDAFVASGTRICSFLAGSSRLSISSGLVLNMVTLWQSSGTNARHPMIACQNSISTCLKRMLQVLMEYEVYDCMLGMWSMDRSEMHLLRSVLEVRPPATRPDKGT